MRLRCGMPEIHCKEKGHILVHSGPKENFIGEYANKRICPSLKTLAQHVQVVIMFTQANCSQRQLVKADTYFGLLKVLLKIS